MTKTEFLAQIKAQRLANKGRWVFYVAEVNGYTVRYKAYNTWVQIFSIELPNRTVKDSGLMDCSVVRHNAFVQSMLDLIPDPATA